MVKKASSNRASQTEDTYEALRAAILAGHYLPGQKLKIGELCDDVQGSLGAVREALSRLLADGLVLAEPFKGFAVAPVSPEDLVQLTEARIEVEKLCLASAIANGDLEWEGRLVSLLHRLLHTPEPVDSGGEVGEWWHVHTEFHEVLVSACNNAWLLRMHRTLHEQSERYRRLALKVDEAVISGAAAAPATRRNTIDEHRELVDAALARDAGRIGAIIETHLRRTTNHLLVRLEHPDLRTAVGGTPVVAAGVD